MQGANVDIVVPEETDINLNIGGGQIEIENVTGEMTIDSGGGPIKLNDVTLKGTSSLRTGAGPIEFDGALDSQGRYHIRSGAGPIDITLPADSSFSLDTDARHVDNDFGSTEVGSSPHPRLTIDNTIGGVEIHKK